MKSPTPPAAFSRYCVVPLLLVPVDGTWSDCDGRGCKPAGTSSDRKRLTGSQKRKLRRQSLRANEAACSAAALQSPVVSTMAPKRRKDSKDSPPQGMRSPKRPKPARLPTTNTELAGVGLSAAQRTNPLTAIVADAGYPESVLSPEQYEFFREATLHALDKEPASN